MKETRAGWEENVRQVVPYVPGEQPKEDGVIKLNTNENPYPPSPKVEAALRGEKVADLRKYPDPTAEMLVDAIAQQCGVTPDMVYPGVGSDDVLSMCFMTFFQSGKPLLFPDITYSFYDVWAQLYRIPYLAVPLDKHFHIQKEDYYTENGGIIFPNPNAPTGIEESQDMVEDIIQHNPDSVVIVDEAYVDFGGTSALPFVKKYDNLLVVQTFSKSRSMAGMRIGYAIGSPKLIEYLNRVKYSFNSYTMSRTAIEAGTAAMEDKDYFETTRNKIIETREWSKKELARLGFTFPDSKANFLFVTNPKLDAKKLFEDLKQAKIYVRYFDKPRINQYLRITIGTQEEMQALIHFLENYSQD